MSRAFLGYELIELHDRLEGALQLAHAFPIRDEHVLRRLLARTRSRLEQIVPGYLERRSARRCA